MKTITVPATHCIGWMFLRRIWQGWQKPLLIVQPETVIRWYRRRFRAFWRRKSRAGWNKRQSHGPLVRLLEDRGKEVYEARRIRPSLEDVFVRITGIAADELKRDKEKKMSKPNGGIPS